MPEPVTEIPTKSQAWLEAECLRIATGARGGAEIQRVMIRRLRPKGPGSNWKVADLIPQPNVILSRELRDALAHLPKTYALEE
jgi:hypothetical protein